MFKEDVLPYVILLMLIVLVVLMVSWPEIWSFVKGMTRGIRILRQLNSM